MDHETILRSLGFFMDAMWVFGPITALTFIAWRVAK